MITLIIIILLYLGFIVIASFEANYKLDEVQQVKISGIIIIDDTDAV